MSTSKEYDQQKEETSHYFTESDAIDEVFCDIKGLEGSHVMSKEDLETLIEHVEEWIHYNESLEYILRNIPAFVKEHLLTED